MAHKRAQSTTEALKEPHLVSLKVLRLSKPSLALQSPLPTSQNKGLPVISDSASRSYPSEDKDDFQLSPLLSLPPGFGSAHVGETFSCTLCANNELSGPEEGRRVTYVKISADIQSPSGTYPLGLSPGTDGIDVNGLDYGKSLQKIVLYDLKEEGNHTLAVTVTYTETIIAPNDASASGGRVRTFRKLYQFLAQQCLAVRTKAGELHSESRNLKFLLEAQLENISETSISLEKVLLAAKPPFMATSLNWDIMPVKGLGVNSPVINPRDIQQVAFLLEQQDDDEEGRVSLQQDLTKDGKTGLGQLNIQWRTSMGERGILSTAWLSGRRK